MFELGGATGNGCMYLSIRYALLAEKAQTQSALAALQHKNKNKSLVPPKTLPIYFGFICGF
jgi:hypothetical protein